MLSGRNSGVLHAGEQQAVPVEARILEVVLDEELGASIDAGDGVVGQVTP